ncbi:MAG: AMP-binding protein, partial [Weissella cibaria]
MTVLTSGLQAQLTAHADDVMLVSLADGRQYTGQQVTALVEQMKQTLVAQAIGAGDVVLIALANHWLYPILEQALWEIGAIAHPVAPTSGVREILDEFADYHYAAGIFAESFRPALATQTNFLDQTVAIHEQPVYFYRYQQGESFQDGMTLSDDSLAVILNTSGSTGKPKRVGLTHAQLSNSAHHIATSQHLTNQDATMVVMPMFHVNAQVIAMLSTRL